MKLNELSDKEGATHSRKRLGRGIGSGSGKTGAFVIPLLIRLLRAPPRAGADRRCSVACRSAAS